MNKEDIGYAWNFVADLGNGKQFSISANFATGTTKEHMNAEVDKVNAVADRLQAKAAAVGVEQEIGQFKLRRDSAAKDLAMLDESNSDKSLSASQRQQREAAVKHIEKMDDDIKYREDFLAKLKEEAK